jgi:hypothetical protein
MTTVVDNLLETVLGDEAAMEVTVPPLEGRALVFVVGPRVGQPVSIAPTPRPGQNRFSSRLASVLPRRDSSPSSEASEAAVQQVRRMLHRIRTTSESEAWGVSPIETYMERRFRGKDS